MRAPIELVAARLWESCNRDMAQASLRLSEQLYHHDVGSDSWFYWVSVADAVRLYAHGVRPGDRRRKSVAASGLVLALSVAQDRLASTLHRNPEGALGALQDINFLLGYCAKQNLSVRVASSLVQAGQRLVDLRFYLQSFSVLTPQRQLLNQALGEALLTLYGLLNEAQRRTR